MAADQVMSLPVEGDSAPALPPEAYRVLQLMSGCAPQSVRRLVPRANYWAPAALEIVGFTPIRKPMKIYTRDISEKSVGFIAQTSWVDSADAVIHLEAPSGRRVSASGYVQRCRELGNGWFEGVIMFFSSQAWLRASEVAPVRAVG